MAVDCAFGFVKNYRTFPSCHLSKWDSSPLVGIHQQNTGYGISPGKSIGVQYQQPWWTTRVSTESTGERHCGSHHQSTNTSGKHSVPQVKARHEYLSWECWGKRVQSPYLTMFSCVIGLVPVYCKGCIILGRLYVSIHFITMSVKGNGKNICKVRTLIDFKIIFRVTTQRR